MAQHNLLRLRVLGLLLTTLLLSPPAVSAVVSADEEQQLNEIDKSIRHRDYRKAVSLLAPLLEKQNPTALYKMAELYRTGKGVEKDLEQAVDLYTKAAEKGHVKAQFTVASILEKKGDFTDARFWYQQAAEQGFPKAQKKLEQLLRAIKNAKSRNTEPEKIFSAIIRNDIEQIKSFIEWKIDFNIVDEQNRSPLMVALLTKRETLSSLLVPVTGSINHADSNKNQALHLATSNQYYKTVAQLLQRKANVNAQDKLGNTPLIIAIRHDDPKMVNLLLSYHADPAIKNKKHNSAFDLAKINNQKNMTRIFAQHKIKLPENNQNYAQININTFQKSIDKSGSLYKNWPLLNIASLLGETEIVRQLINQGMDINAVDPDGYSALHRAASKGQNDIIKKILSSGAKVNIKNRLGETPLYLAAQAGHVKTLKLLVNAGADTSLLTQNKKSALLAAITGQHKSSALLLSKGKLNKLSLHQALLQSILSNMQSVSLALIKKDKLLNKRDENRRSALWHSASLGQLEVVKAILKRYRQDLNERDVNGYSPLARATLNGHQSMVELLLKQGADLNVLTEDKNNILMLSVLSGKKAFIAQLIKQGAEINQKNNAGNTALMIAASAGNNAVIEQLIHAGADMQLRNSDDMNAYQIAIKSGHKESAEIIRKNSGRLFQLFN